MTEQRIIQLAKQTVFHDYFWYMDHHGADRLCRNAIRDFNELCKMERDGMVQEEECITPLRLIYLAKKQAMKEFFLNMDKSEQELCKKALAEHGELSELENKIRNKKRRMIRG